MKTALRVVSAFFVAALFSLVLGEFSFREFPDQTVRFTGERGQTVRTVEKTFSLEGVEPDDLFVFEAVFFTHLDRRTNFRLSLNGDEIASFSPAAKTLRLELPPGSLRNGTNSLGISASAAWSYRVLRIKNIYGHSSGFPEFIVLNKRTPLRTASSLFKEVFFPVFLGLFFAAVFVLTLGVPHKKSPLFNQSWPVRGFAALILLFFLFIPIIPILSKYRILLHFRSTIHLAALFLGLAHFTAVWSFLRSLPKKTARLAGEWQESLAVFAISRVAIYGIGYLSSLVIAEGPWFSTELPTYFLQLFFKWDSFWHQEIAQLGYYFAPGKPSNIAFFPFYPMVAQLSSFAAGTLRTNGFVISNLATLLAVFYLIKIARLELGDEPTAQRAALYFLIFPGSLFFAYFYSEGLFLFLTLGAFYHARRKEWFAASLFGLFASLTKVIGIVIAVPLFLEHFKPRFEGGKFRINRLRRESFLLGLVPLGPVGFMAYCGLRFGDPLAFIHAHAIWGTKALSPAGIREKIAMLPLFYEMIYLGLIGLAILAIIALIRKKASVSLVLYPILLIIIVLFTNAVESTPRQLSIAFPLFIGLAVLGKNRLIHHLLVITFLSLLTLFTILSANGYWLV